MNNRRNLQMYRRWAPVYDFIFRPLFRQARQEAVQMLALQPGERLLLPGVGTGLDLPHLPSDIEVVGGDLSPAMLHHAVDKVQVIGHNLLELDAQRLPLPDGCCDAALLSLVVSVVPDGAAAFREVWRVLKPGGRVVIFDKFLPETAALSPVRRMFGWLVARVGTDVNRRLSDVLAGTPGARVEQNKPSLLWGQYRIVCMWKTESSEEAG